MRVFICALLLGFSLTGIVIIFGGNLLAILVAFVVGIFFGAIAGLVL